MSGTLFPRIHTREWTCRLRGGTHDDLREILPGFRDRTHLPLKSPVRLPCTTAQLPTQTTPSSSRPAHSAVFSFAFSRRLLGLGTLAHAHWLSGTFFRKCLLESVFAHVFLGVCLTDLSVLPETCTSQTPPSAACCWTPAVLARCVLHGTGGESLDPLLGELLSKPVPTTLSLDDVFHCF